MKNRDPCASQNHPILSIKSTKPTNLRETVSLSLSLEKENFFLVWISAPTLTDRNDFKSTLLRSVVELFNFREASVPREGSTNPDWITAAARDFRIFQSRDGREETERSPGVLHKASPVTACDECVGRLLVKSTV